ncbi:MAG: hypothetical protein HRT73_15425 [Flavobacteriales bacterium]|nr:hypothetical protein [Flavobacteriales bacterium]
MFIALVCLAAICTAKTFEDQEEALFRASNKARSDPFYYKEIVANEYNGKFSLNAVDKFAICYEPADFDSQGFAECKASRETYEGRTAWMDAIVYLSEKATPKPALAYSHGLSKACRDHVLDIGSKGLFSHTGSDGSTPAIRASRHVFSGDANVENLAFIDESAGLSPEAESVITQMLINDGELDRDTRNNLLSEEFTHLGVACGCHSSVGEVCCFAYGSDIDDGAQGPMQSLTDVPREKCDEDSSQGPAPTPPTSQRQNLGPGHGPTAGAAPVSSRPSTSQKPGSQYRPTPQQGARPSLGGYAAGFHSSGPTQPARTSQPNRAPPSYTAAGGSRPVQQSAGANSPYGQAPALSMKPGNSQNPQSN